MSWEVQGRQFHGWFGTGTGSDGGEQQLSDAQVTAVVVAGAAASMSGELRESFDAYLDQGGGAKLSQALPIWAGSSGLDAGAFRASMTGPELPDAAASALQDAGRLFAGAQSVGELQAASARLADAVTQAGPEWRYEIGYARDQAAWAVKNGAGAATALQAGSVVSAVMPGAAAASSGAIVEGVAAGAAALRFLGPWGTAAAAVLGVGLAAYLLLSKREQDRDTSAESTVSPMRPPDDASNPTGPKAPGKPGGPEGFRSPKTGDNWVKAPDERGYGWQDADGNVWVPTGLAGAPGSGTAGPAHGGPHWDVQDAKGNRVGNAYPGGKWR